jgi:protein required for attachment to host cells
MIKVNLNLELPKFMRSKGRFYMNQNLIIIGNKEATNLFTLNKSHSKLVKIDSIENPDARKKEKDLVTDSPGRVQKGNRSGSRSVGMENKAIEHSLDQYSSKVSKLVAKKQGQIDKPNILLVSEPGFLGQLKRHFKIAKVDIAKTIPKELNHLDEKSIFSRIKEDLK